VALIQRDRQIFDGEGSRDAFPAPMKSFLDEFLLEKLAAAGTPAAVAFDDQVRVIALETLGTRAGLSL